MRFRRLPTLFTMLVLAAVLFAAPATAAAGRDEASRATGAGSFLYAGTIAMKFSFSAVQLPNGSVAGHFHHSYVSGGFTYDFSGKVTCIAFDAVNGRAWIGGVLTKVRSTDPTVGEFAGDDAWFRVLDSPGGERSTAMGFVGAIPSSAAYCAMKIWPDGNART